MIGPSNDASLTLRHGFFFMTFIALGQAGASCLLDFAWAEAAWPETAWDFRGTLRLWSQALYRAPCSRNAGLEIARVMRSSIPPLAHHLTDEIQGMPASVMTVLTRVFRSLQPLPTELGTSTQATAIQSSEACSDEATI
ncbi:hypothetical protein VNO77_03617 [Canavalia gladiata]|uniref:Uncharacterized protein n=1 Tax=Canavalia gladiata TaxID=3824 RepID=A0AAN9RCE5_CANGL